MRYRASHLKLGLSPSTGVTLAFLFFREISRASSYHRSAFDVLHRNDQATNTRNGMATITASTKVSCGLEPQNKRNMQTHPRETNSMASPRLAK